jgi:hypothetical protein
MPASSQKMTLTGQILAFEMMGRAFEALALLYEVRHPGEYVSQSEELKAFIAYNFRQVEQTFSAEEIESQSFLEAVLAVREVFDRVDSGIMQT